MTQEQKERLEEVIVMPLGVISGFITFLPGFIITTMVGIIDLLFIMPISAIIRYIKYGEGEAYDLMNTVDWGWIIAPGLHAAYDWQYKRENKRWEKILNMRAEIDNMKNVELSAKDYARTRNNVTVVSKPYIYVPLDNLNTTINAEDAKCSYKKVYCGKIQNVSYCVDKNIIKNIFLSDNQQEKNNFDALKRDAIYKGIDNIINQNNWAHTYIIDVYPYDGIINDKLVYRTHIGGITKEELDSYNKTIEEK